jgi:hypothetical protein
VVPAACSRQRTATRHSGDLAVSVNPAPAPIDPLIARIRDEGLNNSKAMDTLSHLCDVIGPRLTGSPACRLANEWTRDTLSSWGLADAHLEAWGPFGRGWSVRRFSMQVVEPYAFALNGYPKAWSPGLEQSVTEMDVVHVDAKNEADLAKFKGQLKGKLVLLGAPRSVEARFAPLATRIAEADLQKMADAPAGSSALFGQARAQTAGERRAQLAESGASGEALLNRRRQRDQGSTTRDVASAARPTSTEPVTGPTSRPGRGRFRDPFASRLLKFAADEGAAVVVTASSVGDGGTFFVSSASVPGEFASTQPASAGPTTATAAAPTTVAAAAPTTRPRVWSADAPSIPSQVTLAVEDYNRLARMIKAGEQPRVAVDLQVEFHDDDLHCYNTIAEIPGTDPQLKDQIVMVGAHLDSWHSGTGATDNAVGCAAAMEAVRILRALDLRPRRTIRVALWTGEEQGLFGSAAYVKKHFGNDPDSARSRGQRQQPQVADPAAGDASGVAATPAAQPEPATRRVRRILKEKDYENLSVYFNLDNGTGRIRGIYAQGNEAAVPHFKRWLAPFSDLEAKTVTLANTGGTDHQSFDAIGLPGFQFIQDPIEYSSRTHHSNYDVYDRLQADDVKQASTIMAAFVWQAANMDERFPRKPMTMPTTAPDRGRAR